MSWGRRIGESNQVGHSTEGNYRSSKIISKYDLYDTFERRDPDPGFGRPGRPVYGPQIRLFVLPLRVPFYYGSVSTFFTRS